jgi:ribosome-associated protein
LKRATAAKQKQLHTANDDLNDLIIDSITDIKGKKIVKLDLRALDDAPTEYFIICEGDSNTQIRAIAENIHFRVKQELGQSPAHLEGLQSARWVCLDYFSTVVHVFHREARAFYGLEDLWNDAQFTEYENI